MTFPEIIAQAKLHIPGGRFNSEDLAGLRIRGVKMGLSHAEVDQIIADTPAAKRTPLQHEQWK